MDIQLFATDEELREFPENKTDSSTVQDKTPSSKDINLMASDLPRSHTDLPKIPSRLPEGKSKCKSRWNHRCKPRSKNPIVGRQAVQANDHIDTKQEKLWVIRLTHARLTSISWWVIQLVLIRLKLHCPWSIRPWSISPWPISPYSVCWRQLLPWSISPWSASPWSISPVVQFLCCCPFASSPT